MEMVQRSIKSDKLAMQWILIEVAILPDKNFVSKAKREIERILSKSNFAPQSMQPHIGHPMQPHQVYPQHVHGPMNYSSHGYK